MVFTPFQNAVQLAHHIGTMLLSTVNGLDFFTYAADQGVSPAGGGFKI